LLKKKPHPAHTHTATYTPSTHCWFVPLLRCCVVCRFSVVVGVCVTFVVCVCGAASVWRLVHRSLTGSTLLFADAASSRLLRATSFVRDHAISEVVPRFVWWWWWVREVLSPRHHLEMFSVAPPLRFGAAPPTTSQRAPTSCRVACVSAVPAVGPLHRNSPARSLPPYLRANRRGPRHLDWLCR
jgi:hypothetical protein